MWTAPDSKLRQCAAPAAAAVGVVLSLGGCTKEEDTALPAPPAGASVVFDSVTGGVSRERFETMRWPDVAPTAEVTLRHGLVREVLAESSEVSVAPCLYLRAMLELAASKPERALAEWDRIEVAEMPPDFLYAPWRIARGTGRENRYDSALAACVDSGSASPLVAARWHAIHGAYVEALDHYLQSDPSRWTPHEIDQFRVMKLYGPVARDVDLLLAGALQAGRVPDALRADLARLIKRPQAPDEEQVMALLRSEPVIAKAATRAVRRQFDLRRAFAADRFGEVVERTHLINPSEAPEETVLLAFLAASKTGDHALADQWAEELLRRRPGIETEKWIREIKRSSR